MTMGVSVAPLTVFAALLAFGAGWVARTEFPAEREGSVVAAQGDALAAEYFTGRRLFDCEGTETGKVEGYSARIQLLLECWGDVCNVKLGFEEFTAQVAEDGRLVTVGRVELANGQIASGPHYFEFDRTAGRVQGVSGAPYYYFVGACSERPEAPLAG